MGGFLLFSGVRGRGQLTSVAVLRRGPGRTSKSINVRSNDETVEKEKKK